jgi:methylphosphotriester-DNA--protein-cysteine methyltransferase
VKRAPADTLGSMPGYREHPAPPALASLVACFWENEVVEDSTRLIVPDGCLDLIWFAERELLAVGADTGPRHVDVARGHRFAAVRLRPGAAGAVLGLPAVELRDRQVPISLLWGDDGARLEEAVASAEAPGRRLDVLAAAIARRQVEPDRIVLAAARLLAAPRARVADVAAALGVSERHLHRRLLASIGYGPKVLARVARLRRLIAIGESPLARRALEAGYASQAHMNDEVRRLTGTTPVRFLEDAVLTTA